MDKEHAAPGQAPPLAELFPELSAAELQEAEYRLDRYLTLALAVFERLEQDEAPSGDEDVATRGAPATTQDSAPDVP